MGQESVERVDGPCVPNTRQSLKLFDRAIAPFPERGDLRVAARDRLGVVADFLCCRALGVQQMGFKDVPQSFGLTILIHGESPKNG
jgi:hypothetical protein